MLQQLNRQLTEIENILVQFILNKHSQSLAIVSLFGKRNVHSPFFNVLSRGMHSTKIEAT